MNKKRNIILGAGALCMVILVDLAAGIPITAPRLLSALAGIIAGTAVSARGIHEKNEKKSL